MGRKKNTAPISDTRIDEKTIADSIFKCRGENVKSRDGITILEQDKPKAIRKNYIAQTAIEGRINYEPPQTKKAYQ